MTSSNPQARAIVGMGALSSVGHNVAKTFEAVCRGNTGLADLRRFETAAYRTTNAYPIFNEPDRMGAASEWLCQVVADAAWEAGLGDDLSDIPVLVGTGLRELRSIELAWQNDVSPPALDFGPALRERFGCTEVHTWSNACSASLYALALGDDLLTLGRADSVIVAGVDTITESMFASLDTVQPSVKALRPFAQGHKGVLMGDGAAAVVLRRSGNALAWLRGVAINCDAHHVTAPDPVGIRTAIRDAHDLSSVRPEQIDMVVAHGTGTQLNDSAEATALSEVFGELSPFVTAVKSMLGHTSGSSGLLSLVIAVEAMRSGRIPPIPGLEQPMAEASSLNLAVGGMIDVQLDIAQVNAFGFGGVNAVAVVERAR